MLSFATGKRAGWALAFLLSARAGALRAETVVSLEFDDEYSSQYQVRSLLQSHGMRATFFINSGRIGASGYMTLSQIHDLENDGHEIAGHTINHLDLTTLSAADAEHQVCDDRAALLGYGFQVTSFAYPFGVYNSSVQGIVAGCGYTSARIVGGVGCSGCPSAETIPPADPYATRTPASVKKGTSLATLEGWVMAAEAKGGGWVQFVMHEVCDGSSCSTYSVSSTTLTGFLDWLAPRAASGTVVKTVREVMGQGPPGPGPDTTPPQTTVSCSPRGCSEWSNGPVTVTLSASDTGSGVAEIRYTTDGSDPAGPSAVSCGSSQCGFTVSVTTTVKYQASDLAGNLEAVKTQVIGIDTQPPSVAITSPADQAVVRGLVTVKASAGDDVGIAEVRFHVDGTLIGTSSAAPYQARWQSRKSGVGQHVLRADAADLAGNITQSRTVTVIVGS